MEIQVRYFLSRCRHHMSKVLAPERASPKNRNVFFHNFEDFRMAEEALKYAIDALPEKNGPKQEKLQEAHTILEEALVDLRGLLKESVEPGEVCAQQYADMAQAVIDCLGTGPEPPPVTFNYEPAVSTCFDDMIEDLHTLSLNNEDCVLSELAPEIDKICKSHGYILSPSMLYSLTCLVACLASDGAYLDEFSRELRSHFHYIGGMVFEDEY